MLTFGLFTKATDFLHVVVLWRPELSQQLEVLLEMAPKHIVVWGLFGLCQPAVELLLRSQSYEQTQVFPSFCHPLFLSLYTFACLIILLLCLLVSVPFFLSLSLFFLFPSFSLYLPHDLSIYLSVCLSLSLSLSLFSLFVSLFQPSFSAVFFTIRLPQDPSLLTSGMLAIC